VRFGKLLFGAAVAAAGAIAYEGGMPHGGRSGEIVMTGFVEGEERVLRSEVQGRVLEVLSREGESVTRGALLVRIDARDAASKRDQQALAVALAAAEVAKAEAALALARTQVEGATRIAEAELARAEADAHLAKVSLERTRDIVKRRAASKQELDDAENAARRAETTLNRQQQALAQARDRRGEVKVAEETLAVLRARLPIEREKLRELDLLVEKYEVRAAETGTIQARLLNPGELAQPGRAVISMLDEADKYVRVYIPVPDLRAIGVGTDVEIELDLLPGSRIPGKVEWIESQATFTPRKIYTQDDRTQQVYQARVRLAPGQARTVKAGAEANVRVAHGS
jgi:HlyD family secretion protein